MRTTKKQLEAKVAWLQRDVDDHYSRSKEWKRYADVMEALLRLGEHHLSYQTLRVLADELRAAAEKPTTSSDIIATQLEAVAPLAAKFYEKEDALVSKIQPRDLRIPIRWDVDPPHDSPAGKAVINAVNKTVSGAMAEFRAARDKISQPNSRPKSPPKRPARSRPT